MENDDEKEDVFLLQSPLFGENGNATETAFRDLGITPLVKQLKLKPEQTNGHWCSRCQEIWFGYTLETQCPVCGKLIAERNRGWFAEQNILALNIVSSPGSGKTTLLERTLNDLKSEFEISVIEGDQETIHDAERIRSTGCKAVQINTGTGCHLEADMLARGLESLNPSANSLLFIENVGNLVCPAMFDLGERAKVAILSVTEGEDKPLKYPHMFRASELIILNKIDLLPYVKFDVEKCVEYAKEVNPRIEILQVSATTGEGMPEWYECLKKLLQTKNSSISAAITSGALSQM